MVFQCTATVDILPHKLGRTSSDPVLYNIIHVTTQRWILVGWTKNEPTENTNYASLHHKHQTEGSSVYLHIAITIHNYIAVIFTYFYHIISILQFIYTRSLLPNTNLLADAFGIFVFKLPYICNSINQCYSSCLSIWRDRVTSLNKVMVSQTQQKDIPFKIKPAHMLCV